ncbi:MAG: 2-oxoacid:acceptor oxidoreductase family protein [Actinomycetaceae bacterium]|nr:2-oxoacid:acceptor oxidoreductase family protein [Actinomycetaceae bacterium]
MTEVRIHGRGGQGVVTAADLMAYAAFMDGHHAQAFPSFGSERTGAPVVSYCRISDTEIRTREPVLEPDVVVVQDPTLLPIMDVFSGLRPDGYALVNSSKSADELGFQNLVDKYPQGHILTIPASDLAKEHLGRPLPNAVLLGGIAALTGLVKLSSVSKAICHKFSGTVGEGNVAAAAAAYELLTEMKQEARRA